MKNKPVITNITIGSDPEFAAHRFGNPFSVIGHLRGTKKEPHQLNEFVSCQVDNVGAETCIPPCTKAEEFLHYIEMSRKLTERQLPEGVFLASKSSQRYPADQLNNEIAMLFGCEPSFEVYSGQISPRPSPADIGNLRSFGFHVHIGYQTEEGQNAIIQAERLIRAMDITCGLASILIDQDTDRRSLYGNAGDLRYRTIKDISVVEYRTLGAFMHSSPELILWVFNQTMKAVEMVNNWQEEYEEIGLRVKNAINTGNTHECEELLSHFGITLPYLQIKPVLV